MTSFSVPQWYRRLGQFLSPLVSITGSPRVGPWPTVPPGSTWIHAASLGELKGVLRLLEALPPDHPVFLTSTTRAGLELLQGQAPLRTCSVLPLDSPAIAAAFLDAIRPSCAVFFESETWPCLLARLQERKVPVAFAAFRTGPDSMRRWTRFSKSFPGWTESVNIVWTDGISPLEPVRAMGFDEVRAGSPMKWAGCESEAKAPMSHRRAAVSIHLRDFAEILRMMRLDRSRGWLLFPRRLRLRHPLRLVARLAGFRPCGNGAPAPGEVWIAPRFGLARELLGTCAWTWVSEGHDTDEPYMLGSTEVWTGSPPRRIDRPMGIADRMRTEIVQWIMECPIRGHDAAESNASSETEASANDR